MMKKVILAPDSFKGTISSEQICSIMEKGIKQYFPKCEIVKIPMADGGEGTVDCFLTACGGKRETISVTGPYGEPLCAYYGIINDGQTAVVEMAQVAGLPLVEGRENPAITTTFGVGQIILDAASKGVSHVILGLGGSCTNDAGCGVAAACGVKFLDENDVEFVPVGQTLTRIAKIDTSGVENSLKSLQLTAICDIDNPLYGQFGAAYMFSPQKGADKAMAKLLDENLVYLSQLVKKQLDIDISDIAGGGAAGGMGAGMSAFLSATLMPGIDIMLHATDFDRHLDGCDMVFTGEGKLDLQSVRGKVISGVAKSAGKKNVPVCAVVGDVDDDIQPIYDLGVTAVFSINRKAIPFSIAKIRSAYNLEMTFDNILRFWAASCKVFGK